MRFSSEIENNSHGCPYKNLWCSVITTALDDVSYNGREGVTMLQSFDCHTVISWVGSNDFYDVCRLVGIEPKATKDMFEKVINDPAEYYKIKKTLSKGY